MLGLLRELLPSCVDFMPLQEARCDGVFSVECLDRHPSLSIFLDVLVRSYFRAAMEAIGG